VTEEDFSNPMNGILHDSRLKVDSLFFVVVLESDGIIQKSRGPFVWEKQLS